MQNYTVNDTINQQATPQTTATEQQLPQTGSASQIPQMMFGSALFLLGLALAFKVTSMLRGDA